MSTTELAQALRRVADLLDADEPAPPPTHETTLDRIMREVSTAHSVSVTEMRSPSRARHLHPARVEAYRRIRDELNWSYPVIGDYFARHHSTIISALEP